MNDAQSGAEPAGRAPARRAPASETRVDHQPAFVLHSYAWRETSLIVEMLSRDFGRVALVARGAKRVYAVDVGTGQLHPRLQAHAEIVSMEQTDIRTLDPSRLAEPPDLAVIDVSFISLKLVLPAIGTLLRTPAAIVALIKPQFEAKRSAIKKGIVRDPAVHAAVCDDIAAFFASAGWRVSGVIPSPIEGGDGNREFFIEAERG